MKRSTGPPRSFHATDGALLEVAVAGGVSSSPVRKDLREPKMDEGRPRLRPAGRVTLGSVRSRSCSVAELDGLPPASSTRTGARLDVVVFFLSNRRSRSLAGSTEGSYRRSSSENEGRRRSGALDLDLPNGLEAMLLGQALAGRREGEV